MATDDDPARAATLAADSADVTRDDSLGPRAADAARAGEPGPGQTVGRYRLIARLGAGAMGVVWSASDPQLERKVAVKLVHPRLATSPEAAMRMLREARAMAKLSHRAVVTVHDAGELDGRLFLAMELIDGQTLTARLGKQDLARPAAWRERLALILEAGRGLAAAHAAGVLHRDFKPDNVLVAADGRVCVGDFGLATLGDAPVSSLRLPRVDLHAEATLTSTGALLGTPIYMSPQQLRGEPADAAADQFAFCVAAWESLYGARPFAVEASGLAAIGALLGTIERGAIEPPDPTSEVPAAVREVLARGLRADAATRWPNMEAVLAALSAAAGLRARRRRRLRASALAIVGVVAAAAAGAYAYSRRAPDKPTTVAPLFEVPLHARVALGPGGVVAVASDRIEVHEPGRELPWKLELPGAAPEVTALEVDADDITYSLRNSGEPRHWRFRDPALPSAAIDHRARVWMAHLGDGELYADGDTPATNAYVLVRGDRELARWPITWREIDNFAAAPDHRHFAFASPQTHGTALHVLTPDGGDRVDALAREVTAVAWWDASTLLVATSSHNEATLSTLALTATGFGELHELDRDRGGWFTRLASRDGRILVVDGRPESHARVVVRKPDDVSVHDHEPSRIAAPIGWTDDNDMLVWNRVTHRIERVHGSARGVDTPMTLPSEPINATAAGGLRIVAIRADVAREVIGLDAATGAVKWRAEDGKLAAVRCAGDRAPPCVALVHREHADAIVDLDPATGALGATRAARADISDVALRADGHVFVVGLEPFVRELDATGAEVGKVPVHMSTVRSIALDADGAILVGGTALANSYRVMRIAGATETTLVTSDSEILMLVRPSPDGSSVALIARRFTPMLEELVRP